ncbi:DUF4129 domain-containing protein [Tundrisphaera lichenicola]|uniref:DUF4129 domain-containing protein n=1 Tax=Tundrisphaera lichenicola TaxID=2029860 RepID=UPI003EBC8208
MVRRFPSVLVGLALVAVPSLASLEAEEISTTPEIGKALGKGSFPWYDAAKDAIRPIQVPLDRNPDTSKDSTQSGPTSTPAKGFDLGGWIAFGVFSLGLGILVGVLVWFWRRYEPSLDGELDDRAESTGGVARSEELPPGLRLGYDPADPWSEALRRRDRGDLAGAIVCLFAHQLLTLSRLGLLRLAPGRTGRQLLRSITDEQFRRLVTPTLGIFEAAYYGHREPSAEEFAAAWAAAERFQDRVASGVPS